jgi:[ribosomal protein S5]-alanine N-acetyltransferase
MLDFNFSPFPILETERLILRRIVDSDVSDFFLLRSNIELMNALDKNPHLSKQDTIAHLSFVNNRIENNEAITWAVCLKSNNQLIGDFGFHQIDKQNHRAEIGYALLPQFQKLGFATEALKDVLRFGFENLNFHSIEANINPTNQQSQNLVIKNGFKQEALFKENYYFNNVFLDSAIYSLLKKDYLSTL